MKKKKEIIFSVICVLVLVIIAIGFSYATFVFSKPGSKINTITSGTITFTYNETSNGINLVNAKPMTDNAGKNLMALNTENGVNQGYFDFNISSNVVGNLAIKYEIYAELNETSDMDPHYVKVYLTNGAESENAYDGYQGEVPVFSNLAPSTSKDGAKRIYSSTITNPNQVQNFRLRLWISSEYTEANAGKTFNVKINVNAIG